MFLCGTIKACKMEAQPFISDTAKPLPHISCFAHQRRAPGRRQTALSSPWCPARGTPEAALPSRQSPATRADKKELHHPSPKSHGEAVSLSRGILFVEKQVTVEEGLQKRANRSSCAGLITALRRLCSSSVPAEQQRGGMA